MTFKEIRLLSGLSQAQFSQLYEIPKRSIENWESADDKPQKRNCPAYLLKLLERAVREDFNCPIEKNFDF